MEINWTNLTLKRAEEHGSLLGQLAKFHYDELHLHRLKCINDLRELDRRMYPFGYRKAKELGKY